LKPAPDKPLIKTNNIRPVCQWLRNSVVRDHFRSSSVPVLFGFCGPTTVILRVSFVVVDSINGVIRRWRFSHVSQERMKVVKPTVTHSYPTGTVMIERWVVWVVAAGFHAAPATVLLCSFSAVWHRCVAVGAVALSILNSFFFLKTPARTYSTARKMAGFSGFFSSAYTDAPPVRSSSVCVSLLKNTLDNSQAVKFPTGKINKSWHFFTLKWLTVMNAWQSAVNRFSGATLAKRKPFYMKYATKGLLQ
jgi:hypothetical protein